ncbi:protein of unknown function [Acidithiobacillus ferrivorans]|jgi:hypothetical protein|uniref:Uncharacterized protein n=1 Tax=Acidithiobacillus ferrivorans TaxID=160808 RepID=A0A060UUP6_9PROT|nr:hypothetical protein AFERRI_90001 [Acidithiobacillus ferrivorans]SMH66516.1 protein of unknown function [Acidithiobacillus ferrivorans]
MSTYNVKYKYNKPGSVNGTTSRFAVNADSEIVALELAKGQAQNKHPGYEVVILELKKR